MSDDTTTWLKKNPSINPLRKTLRTSLRFHISNQDMESSIISNQDISKNPEMFIPRMMQRPKVQTRMSKAHLFKVPELVAAKAKNKKEMTSNSGVKTTKSPALPKKSFLPVPKTRQEPESSSRSAFLKPSMVAGNSGRRTMARKEIIQKMVELSEVKRVHEVSKQLTVVTSADSSVLHSILKKKRASLRRASQISATKPKVKKVLFERSHTEEKENATSSSFTASQIKTNVDCDDDNNNDDDDDDDFVALDEPTGFFNFPSTQNLGSCLQEPSDYANSCFSEDENRKGDFEVDSVNSLMRLWSFYKENLINLESLRNSFESSFDSLFQQIQSFENKYKTYKKNSEEIYNNISKLGEELEMKFKKAQEECNKNSIKSSKPRQTLIVKKSPKKTEKIRLSDKSKVIKRNSAGRKSVSSLKKGL